MLGNIGPLEIGIVLLIALLIFGAKRLPELGNGLGRGIHEFKDGVTGAGKDVELPVDGQADTHSPPAAAATAATEPSVPRSR